MVDLGSGSNWKSWKTEVGKICPMFFFDMQNKIFIVLQHKIVVELNSIAQVLGDHSYCGLSVNWRSVKFLCFPTPQ